MKRITCIIALLALAFLSKAQTAGSFKDSRDGQTYKTIKIGNQTWMAENLRFKIPGSVNNPENPNSKYGYLYSKEAALKACPSGWHLPSDKEWQTLAMTSGVPSSALNTFGWMGDESNSTQLKSKTGWAENGNGTNALGFNALPAGYYYIDGADKDYANFSYAAYFWSSTKHSDDNSITYYYRLSFKYPGIFRNGKEDTAYYSCRCVKN